MSGRSTAPRWREPGAVNLTSFPARDTYLSGPYLFDKATGCDAGRQVATVIAERDRINREYRIRQQLKRAGQPATAWRVALSDVLGQADLRG